MHRKISLVLVVTASLLAVPSTGHAYLLRQTAEGEQVRWARTEITFCVSEPDPRSPLDRATVTRALRIAAGAWSEVPGVPSIVVDDTVCDDAEPLDGVNTVSVLEHPDEGQPRLAVTRSTYYPSGELIEADVLINQQTPFGMLEEDDTGPRYDLATVLTHELGHVLGLGESEDRAAVMWPRLRRGRYGRRELAPDDVDGVLAIYGHRAAPAVVAYGCRTAPARGRRGALPLLLAVGFALLAHRRR